MSNLVAAIAQRRIVGSATKKAVLMYMAERASDDGSGIWTSKSHMASDTELTKRSVQLAILDFERDGIVRQVGTRPCKNGFTVEYAIDVETLKKLQSTRGQTGEPGARVNLIHPYGCTTFTPTGEPGSPKPSLEPSLEPSIRVCDEEPFLFSGTTQPESQVERSESAVKKKKSDQTEQKKQDQVLAILLKRLGERAALDFIAHRNEMRKPLTPRAAELIIDNLDGCANPDAAVNASIMNGWQGVFPERAPHQAQASTGGYRPVPRWDEDRIER